MHRSVAIDRRDAIQPAFDALLGIVDQVLDVTRSAAEEIVLGHRRNRDRGDTSRLRPSHTTGHAGPHRAVRRVELRTGGEARQTAGGGYVQALFAGMYAAF